MPLCQRLVRESCQMNQTNISTRGSARTMVIAWRTYDACWARVTPAGSAGRVSCPYSVIQIGMPRRLNQTSSDFSNCGSEASETLGQRTF